MLRDEGGLLEDDQPSSRWTGRLRYHLQLSSSGIGCTNGAGA